MDMGGLPTEARRVIMVQEVSIGVSPRNAVRVVYRKAYDTDATMLARVRAQRLRLRELIRINVRK